MPSIKVLVPFQSLKSNKLNFSLGQHVVLELFVDANAENLKATCKVPWNVKDFSALVPESYLMVVVPH